MVTQHHECTNVINSKYYVCFTTHTHTHNFLKKEKERKREVREKNDFHVSNPSEKLDEKTEEKTLSWEAVKHAPPTTYTREFSPCSRVTFPWKEGHSPFHQLASLLAEMRTQALGGNPPRR